MNTQQPNDQNANQQPNEQNKDDPRESDFWKKYDAIFHRLHLTTSTIYYTVFIVGWIILVATAVLTFIVIPYCLIVLVLMQSANIALQFYLWYKKDKYLIPWYMQFLFVGGVLGSAAGAASCFLNIDVQFAIAGGLHVCNAVGWFCLIVLTAYEQNKRLEKTLRELLDIDRDLIGLGKSISEGQHQVFMSISDGQHQVFMSISDVITALEARTKVLEDIIKSERKTNPPAEPEKTKPPAD